MKNLFWMCWSGEIATVFYLMAKEINLPYGTNPLSYYIGLYLMVVLACRYAFDMKQASTVMVVLPAIPFVALAKLFQLPPLNRQSKNEIEDANL